MGAGTCGHPKSDACRLPGRDSGGHGPRCCRHGGTCGDLRDPAGQATAFLSAKLPLEPTLAFRGAARRSGANSPSSSRPSSGTPRPCGWAGSNRYAGDASVYGTTELRLRLARMKVIVPTDFGVFGLADAGRVFLEGENSDTWQRAFGGGSGWHRSIGTTPCAPRSRPAMSARGSTCRPASRSEHARSGRPPRSPHRRGAGQYLLHRLPAGRQSHSRRAVHHHLRHHPAARHGGGRGARLDAGDSVAHPPAGGRGSRDAGPPALRDQRPADRRRMGLRRRIAPLTSILVYLHITGSVPSWCPRFWALVNESFDRTRGAPLDRVDYRRRVVRRAHGRPHHRAHGNRIFSCVHAAPVLSSLHLAAAFLVRPLAASGVRSVDSLAEATAPNAIRILKASTYLRRLAYLIALTATAEGVLDYVFKFRAAQTATGGVPACSGCSPYCTPLPHCSRSWFRSPCFARR